MKKVIFASLMLVSLIGKSQDQTPSKQNLSEGIAKGQYSAKELERTPLSNKPAKGAYNSDALNRNTNTNSSNEQFKKTEFSSTDKIIPKNPPKLSGVPVENPTTILQHKSSPIKTKYSGGLDNVEYNTPIKPDSKEKLVPLKSESSGGI